MLAVMTALQVKSQVGNEVTDNLDFGSPNPLYHQLRGILNRQIRNGELAPGTQLPSEAYLCHRYGVSRTVVRSALQELANRGLIHKRRGVGSFVSPSKISEQLFQRMSGVHEEMFAKGLTFTTEILSVTCTSADALVADRLKVREGSRVHRLVRRRFVEGEALLVGTTYIPVSLVPNLHVEALRNGSLYRMLLREHGLVVTNGHRTFESVGASQDEAKLLNVKVGAPLSRICSVGFTDDAIPVEYFESVHRGDRAQFEVRVVASYVTPWDEGDERADSGFRLEPHSSQSQHLT